MPDPARGRAPSRQVGLEPARSAADVPDAGAEARGTDRLAEWAQNRPLGGHPVQGVSQPAGVEFGEDVMRGPQLVGLRVHGRTIRGLWPPVVTTREPGAGRSQANQASCWDRY